MNAPDKGKQETTKGPTTRPEAQCPLCGCRFEPGENPACAQCSKLFRSCGLVMCPNCGHEFPR